jgi:cell wall-associated NlpC family hydrolase
MRSASRAVARSQNALATSSTTSRVSRTKRKSSLLSLAVTAVVVPGLFATVALPAYAFAPTENDTALQTAVALEKHKDRDAQSVVVDAGATLSAVAREEFTATSEAELAAIAAAAAAAAEAALAEQKRAAAAASFSSYTGPSAAQAAANPTYPSADLSSVVGVARQYIGTPYVFGGSNPGGFDCSGFIKYVFAQFGVSLPHSVSGQAAAGTRIPVGQAVAGDIVIMPGHNGFYMGNGMIMDAPRAGKSISIRPIWTSDYYIVRIGT